MILSFKTHIDKKPTMFTNKIVKSMWQNYGKEMKELALSRKLPNYYIFEELTVDEEEKLKPKIHTIREDKNDRWHNSNVIDFFVYPRNKKMYRFAPKIPCVSIQKIEIEYLDGRPIVVINSTHFYNPTLGIDHGIEELATNDGFDSAKDFFKWFSQDFSGVIIHWTNKIY